MLKITTKYKTTNFVKDFISKNYNHKMVIIGQDPGVTTKNKVNTFFFNKSIDSLFSIKRGFLK